MYRVSFFSLANGRPLKMLKTAKSQKDDTFTMIQAVIVHLRTCVFGYIQESLKTDGNFLLPVRFLKNFCSVTLNARFMLK